MDTFHQRLIERAATIDEIFSDDFESPRDRTGDENLATRRLSAWSRACANGDSGLFERRLARDGLSLEQARTRLGNARRRSDARLPRWAEDAIWVDTSLQSGFGAPHAADPGDEPCPFEHLLLPLVAHAEAMLWSGLSAGERDVFTGAARTDVSRMLLEELCSLCAPALYERFAGLRDAATAPGGPDAAGGTSLYRRFVADMQGGGFRKLFEEKPVLLRLIASLTRQWIESMREFAARLDLDLPMLRRDLLNSAAPSRVARVEGDMSDRHNDGRSVLIVAFEDGGQIVYKPKNLQLDIAWHALIGRLNERAPPIELRAVRAVARGHYGWTEFIEHAGCDDETGFPRFFRRMGAWLALFHCFAATDMHQENIIATGDQPVPIDLETLLQSATPARKPQDTAGSALRACVDLIANSVMTVGVLPVYGRGPDNAVFAMGAMTEGWNARIKLSWTDINTDAMRPAKTKVESGSNPNLPHIGARYAKFRDYVEPFVAGFADYAAFLSDRTKGADRVDLFDGFESAPVRKVVRPTRFYYMLLQRLKNHKSMDDGVMWSAQADFIARLSDWETDADANWPFHRAERAAMLALNVPHFVSMSDRNEVRDTTGMIANAPPPTGLERARARLRNFDTREIAWQTEVIRANTTPTRLDATVPEAGFPARTEIPVAASKDIFMSEAGRIATELSERAIRCGTEAAWLGLDWLGDAETFQLGCVGSDLYNGTCGIAVFLAAHAAISGHAPSAELALAAVAHLRGRLKGRDAARFARLLGIGGASGLGSVIYGLAVLSDSLQDDGLLDDAAVAARLMTDDVITADKRLDVIGGSAGAILGLLRLHRDTQAREVLARAVMCGEHLLRQERIGPPGRRSWIGLGIGPKALNGMSHGAAGFAYALASLAAASGREDFEQAAAECLAFENSSYDADRGNWPDLRHQGAPGWACRWCHGAPGIGLARAALLKRAALDPHPLRDDIHNAIRGTEKGWPAEIDTLCCGTLGSVEFFCEAGEALGRPDLRKTATELLAAVVQAANSAGDYRWNSGKRRFNLGLFRGLAGVGYTLLRQADDRLPNVLIWE